MKPDRRLRLIVHADDLGLSDSVNAGVAQAHREGIVTSASIMAAGPAARDAFDRCRALGSLDLGIHLTLVGERPALPAAQIPTLVTPSGEFYSHATIFIRRYLRREIDLDEVRRELDAQIGLARDAGLEPSHLDSHQHVHVVPGIMRIVAELAKRHGIRAVRLPRERLRPYMLREPGSALRIVQMTALGRLCRRAPLGDLATTDSFVGFFHGGRLDKSNILRVLSSLPDAGTCELMCHPASGSSSHHRAWSYAGDEELAALTDPRTREMVDFSRIRLSTFAELANGYRAS